MTRAFALGFFVYSSAACTTAAHGKESPMFGPGAPSPKFEQVVHIGGFFTRGKEGLVVSVEELPMECLMPLDTPDFDANVAHLAAAWRSHKTVAVTFHGASTIVKVAAPK